MATFVSKGDEEGLRKVEKDVLITKKVKYKAMDLCSDVIKGIHTLHCVIMREFLYSIHTFSHILHRV